MASEGPLLPTAAANDATVGSIDWTNPTNALTNNGTYATVAGANTSRYLALTGFGFASQTGVTDGITARAELSKVNGGSESSIKLIVGGTITGNDKSTGALLNDADTVHTYGGAADKWGVTGLAPADVAASNFGFGISTVGAGAAANRRCDYADMTHTYTAVAVSSPKAVMFFSLLFGLIRLAMCRQRSEPVIRWLLTHVIPSEKRAETCTAMRLGVQPS